MSEEFEIKNNTGYLFNNSHKKEKDTDPDYRGRFTIQDLSYYVSMWSSISAEKNIEYFNLRANLNPKDNQKFNTVDKNFDDANEKIKNNRGYFLKNTKNDMSGRQPVLIGQLRINGDLLNIAAWEKHDKFGNLFYSCSLNNPNNRNQIAQKAKQEMDDFIEDVAITRLSHQQSNKQNIVNTQIPPLNNDMSDDEIANLFNDDNEIKKNNAINNIMNHVASKTVNEKPQMGKETTHSVFDSPFDVETENNSSSQHQDNKSVFDSVFDMYDNNSSHQTESQSADSGHWDSPFDTNEYNYGNSNSHTTSPTSDSNNTTGTQISEQPADLDLENYLLDLLNN